MPSLFDDQWPSLSGHLDRILDLSETERAQYLTDLAGSDPTMAEKLENMLRASTGDAFSGFLRRELPRPTLLTSASALVGRKVGAYVIDDEIGRGGMGSVWRAHRADGRFEGTVAIKFVHLAWLGGAGEQRFRIEGKVLGQLNHVNIARLIDAGVLEDTQPYLVLEYVEGEPIDVYCERVSLGLRGRIELFLSVLDAVSHAHGHLIVHRDIKPTNVFVARDGTVKLLDFGIAKLLSDAPDAAATQTAAMALTPQYAAPEQILAQPVTTGTDVYSLGLVLYLLLSGHQPTVVEGLSRAELIRTVVSDEAPPASRVASIPGIGAKSLAGDLDNILAKALKKSLVERYASVEAFADDLRRYLSHEPITARADSVAYRLGKFLRRNRTSVAVASLIACVLLAATVITSIQKVKADREREEALVAAHKADVSYRFLSSIIEEIGAEGGALTPNKILDRGMYLLEHQRNEESPARVDLLRQMATFYGDLFDIRKMRELSARAEAMARRIGYTEAVIAIDLDHLDDTDDDAPPDPAETDKRLAEARQLYATLRHPEPVLLATFEETVGSLEADKGRYDLAVQHLDRAIKIMADSGNTLSSLYPAFLSRMQVYHDALGHSVEANRYTQLTIAAYDAIEGDGTMHHLINLNNLSVDETNFGEAKAALATSAEVIRRLEARGSIPSAGVPFRANYGLRLAAMGRYPEALASIERAIHDAEDKSLFWLERAKMFRACTLVRAGQNAEAGAALDEVEKYYAEHAVRFAMELNTIETCRAERGLGLGDFAGAKSRLDSLFKSMNYPAEASSPVLRTALPLAARVALARKDYAAAIIYASAGADYAKKVARDPNQSADLGRALVLLATAQHQLGQSAAALETLRHAISSLSGGLGADHQEVGSARDLLADWSQGGDKTEDASAAGRKV